MAILYPTDTLYVLGVNALDPKALEELYTLKGYEQDRPPSWLVRNIEDVESYAILPAKARKLAEQFWPGPLTLILQVRDFVDDAVVAPDRTMGFKISGDLIAEKIINAWMTEYDVPLTSTGANVTGAPVLPTPGEILQQFGEKARLIDEIHDDGPRKGLASTVVLAIGDTIKILREGPISEREICAVAKKTQY